MAATATGSEEIEFHSNTNLTQPTKLKVVGTFHVPSTGILAKA
jgi:hypothetical protein